MSAMRGEATVEEEAPGVYRAEFDLPMGGSWTVTAAIAARDGTAEASFRLTVGQRGLEPLGGAAGVQAETGALPMQHFSPDQLAALREALAAYAEVWEALAADGQEDVAAPAERLAGALGRVDRGGLSGKLPQVLDEAARVARSLAGATALEPARAAFGETSRLVMLLANCDPRVGEGWHAFSCPMTATYPKWIQPAERLANPYMGRAMTSCGEATDWGVPPLATGEVRAHAEHAHGGSGAGDEIAFWTCSMHTSVESAEAGTCPICSMDLVPVTREEATTGIIHLDAQRRQAIGVTTEPVALVPLTAAIRATGKVVYDETRLADVTVKYQGWIRRLYVDRPGQPVARGRPLFTLYSPELYAAQREYLTVLAGRGPGRSPELVQAARQRLLLWDLTQEQIDRLEASGEADAEIPILSPVSGYVVEKHVVEGAAVEAGMQLFRLAALDRVWVEAEVYESELPLVGVGDAATVRLPYLPGRSFPATVGFVYPYLDATSRTGRVRLELPNPRLELKPDMYAEVEIVRRLGERLAIPEEAILYAGDRRFVFLDLGDGRLKPQRVELGLRAGDRVEILEGLEAGDVIVTSGNFLVAAEARLRLDMEHWQ
jgi:Cu(I)/Ag(I) efflux system membrane fusion protein